MAYRIERKRGQAVIFLINGQRIEVKVGRIRCGRVNLAVDADKELVKIVRGDQVLPTTPAPNLPVEPIIPLPDTPGIA